ncbi:hypothetical protein CRUP_007041, partial [Coryphaenoides rupestris]
PPTYLCSCNSASFWIHLRSPSSPVVSPPPVLLLLLLLLLRSCSSSCCSSGPAPPPPPVRLFLLLLRSRSSSGPPAPPPVLLLLRSCSCSSGPPVLLPFSSSCSSSSGPPAAPRGAVMPSRQKQVLLCAAGVLSCAAVLTVCASLGSARWLRGAALCRTGAALVNASGAELHKFVGPLTYGLFQGERRVVPLGLHATVIFFCGVLLLCSSLASGFFFFNAFGSPYEALQGPPGLYLWSASCCVCSCLVMILFAAEVKLHHLSKRIANFNEVFDYETHSETYDVSYWLFLLVFFIHALNFLLIRLAGIDFPFREKKSEVTTGAADLMY